MKIKNQQFSRREYWAVDFDGTLCEHRFPDIGNPKQQVIDVIRRAHERGVCIIIWTCRSGEFIPPMQEWLKRNNIPYDYINENPECNFTTSPKIYADKYIDDRACSLQEVAMWRLSN